MGNSNKRQNPRGFGQRKKSKHAPKPAAPKPAEPKPAAPKAKPAEPKAAEPKAKPAVVHHDLKKVPPKPAEPQRARKSGDGQNAFEPKAKPAEPKAAEPKPAEPKAKPFVRKSDKKPAGTSADPEYSSEEEELQTAGAMVGADGGMDLDLHHDTEDDDEAEDDDQEENEDSDDECDFEAMEVKRQLTMYEKLAVAGRQNKFPVGCDPEAFTEFTADTKIQPVLCWNLKSGIFKAGWYIAVYLGPVHKDAKFVVSTLPQPEVPAFVQGGF
jgi:hypothetical protein